MRGDTRDNGEEDKRLVETEILYIRGDHNNWTIKC